MATDSGSHRYIDAMISSEEVSAEAMALVMRTRMDGQIPAAERLIEATAVTISADVRGIAMRLVSRKYWGKVPKRSHTSGAVRSWQEMDSAAEFQMSRETVSAAVAGRFLTWLPVLLSFPEPVSGALTALSPGYQAFSRG